MYGENYGRYDDVTPIEQLVKIELLSPERMKELEGTKKIDANDLAVRLGPEGLRRWVFDAIKNAPTVYRSRSRVMSFREIDQNYPELRPEVIFGLLRSGEIMNVISGSKIGKSFLGLGLAMSVIQGSMWLNHFRCAQGRVLIIDNELHCETLAERTRLVAEKLKIDPEYVHQWIDFIPLRGELVDIHSLETELADFRPAEYALVILDAMYKFMPERTDENDNGQMAKIYNKLDLYAKKLDSSIVLIHHTSKGNQANKEVTDVGAGAGVQSRAADTHLVIRALEEKGTAKVEAAVRSFEPLEEFGMRFEFPIWSLDKNLDLAKLRGSADDPTAVREKAKEEQVGKVEDLYEGLTFAFDTNALLSRGFGQKIPKWGRYLCKKTIEEWLGTGKIVKLESGGGSVAVKYAKPGWKSDSEQQSPPQASETQKTANSVSGQNDAIDETEIEEPPF